MTTLVKLYLKDLTVPSQSREQYVAAGCIPRIGDTVEADYTPAPRVQAVVWEKKFTAVHVVVG